MLFQGVKAIASAKLGHIDEQVVKVAKENVGPLAVVPHLSLEIVRRHPHCFSSKSHRRPECRLDC